MRHRLLQKAVWDKVMSRSRSMLRLIDCGSRGVSAQADNLGRVNDAESAIGQHHQKFAAVGNEEKMVGRNHRQRAPVGQVDIKRFEGRSIAHFPERLQRHNAGNLPSRGIRVNDAE